MPDFECPKCKDTKHVLVGDEWVRCSCLFEYAVSMAYSRAGITLDPAILTYSPENVKALYPLSNVGIEQAIVEFLIDSFQFKKPVSKTFCFSGAPSSSKDFVLQCVLKKAIDSGYKVASKSLDEIISHNFQISRDGLGEELLTSDEFKHHDILSLSFGNELQYRVGETYLSEFIRLHKMNYKNKILLLNTSLTLEGISKKYDTYDFKDLFVPLTRENAKGPESRVIFLSIL